MEKTPFISLCIVTSNSAHHLAITLNSAKNFVDEIIVGDMGSTDGTQIIADDFGATFINLSNDTTLRKARTEALKNAKGKWILQLNPGFELVVKNRDNILQQLKKSSDDGYYLREYSLENPDDFYYKPLLFKKSKSLEYISEYDESPVFMSGLSKNNSVLDNKLGLLPDLKLLCRDFIYIHEICKQEILQLSAALQTSPDNYSLYYYLAFYYKKLDRKSQFEATVQKGIQIMTQAHTNVLLDTYESSGLFGYFAEMLQYDEIATSRTVESLLQLQKSLIPNILLNTNLAILVLKEGKITETKTLLQEAVYLSFKPSLCTLSFYESFIEPTIYLIDLINSSGSKEELFQFVINVQTLATNNNINIRPFFMYLSAHKPKMLKLIDGILKSKLTFKYA